MRSQRAKKKSLEIKQLLLRKGQKIQDMIIHPFSEPQKEMLRCWDRVSVIKMKQHVQPIPSSTLTKTLILESWVNE